MKKFYRLLPGVLVVVLIAFACVSCAGKKDNQADSSAQIGVRPATTKEYSAATEEEFVKALENFSNPNGNKYDALAVLGGFDYSEKGEELLKRFEGASKQWHAQIVEQVGEKCIVEMTLKDKKDIDLSDSKVVDWETINGMLLPTARL